MEITARKIIFPWIFLIFVLEIQAKNKNTFDRILSLENLVPTRNSPSANCRNQSEFFLKELKNLKLWATEMFDSQSKFPSGILDGSTYDFGNFDECVRVENGEIQGKYCVGKFTVQTPDFLRDYHHFGVFTGNESVWEKVAAFANDRSKGTRNEIYYSFCIPSGCSHQDLQTSVKENFKNFPELNLSISVNKNHCYVNNENNIFTTGDVTFLTVISFFLALTLASTFYDLFTQMEDLEKYKLNGRKHKMLIAFSLSANLKKLSTESNKNENLHCINGLKVLSMFLIIMGHRVMFDIGSSISNASYIETFYEKMEAAVLLNGPIIVNTFFSISGFLTSYLILSQVDSSPSKKIPFGLIYLHRFTRLIPSYAVVIAFYCTIFIKIGSGPFWMDKIGTEQGRCLESWWANLLYINNYVNKDSICMFQSWYLTCDVHFFLLAPIIIWILIKKPLIGLGILLFIIISSICVIFVVVLVTNQDAILLLYMKFLRDPVLNDTFKNVYIPTHMRASPYFVGVLTGYLKYRMKFNGFKIPKWLGYLGWCIMIVVAFGTIYFAFVFYIPGKPHNAILAAGYAALHHFFWSVCVSWMIIAVSGGQGSWIKPILGWKPFTLLSRISYTVFLCHGAIQIYSSAIRRHSNYVSVYTLLVATFSDITISYIFGFILSMTFESPVISLEKIFLTRNKSPENEENLKNQTELKLFSKI